jgi:hypothetical protein
MRANQPRTAETGAQAHGVFCRRQSVVRVLIIAGAALVAEVLIALLAGSCLDRGSETARAPESQAIPVGQGGSPPTASGVQTLPETGQP